MMWLWIIALVCCVAPLIHLLYIRYIPIKGVPCIDRKKRSDRIDQVTVDIRDYQQSSNDVIEGAIVMPVPYLRRYHHEIPTQSIHLVASDHLERNIAIRYLKAKGFQITGYTLTDCRCKKTKTSVKTTAHKC
ncbi:hypothetical protein J416_11727 [Gracilibacillus halophilus YIM-C55.5]|uniref:Rhodanese domain-containing protein n=1 Tax=Gracilibacillus halophilus YIM-C55.5 TaxID=1308866 RepID=N4WAI3_9BACI|nr:hypothetical protein [Gracilibacillus halophilus]ENH96284.1 hypothetical protein J416_11727 [Gracilibacillus halophilus YIM-C55.5]